MTTKQINKYNSRRTYDKRISRHYHPTKYKNIQKIIKDLCDNKSYCSEQERGELKDISSKNAIIKLKTLGYKYINTNSMLAYDIFSKLKYEEGRKLVRDKLIKPKKNISKEQLETNHAWIYFALTKDQDKEGLKYLVAETKNNTIKIEAQKSLEKIIKN